MIKKILKLFKRKPNYPHHPDTLQQAAERAWRMGGGLRLAKKAAWAQKTPAEKYDASRQKVLAELKADITKYYARNWQKCWRRWFAREFTQANYKKMHFTPTPFRSNYWINCWELWLYAKKNPATSDSVLGKKTGRRPKQKWTAEQMEELRTVYPKHGISACKLSLANHSKRAIYAQLSKHQIRRKRMAS